MTSSIEKFLAKITAKEKNTLDNIVKKVKIGNLSGLDVKKLSGHEDIFRVRKGKFRIIFQITKTSTKILSIEKRSDTTYNL
jgi:mRNA-degrading endonuclease RelE of RelBE toxin-antitoxin system